VAPPIVSCRACRALTQALRRRGNLEPFTPVSFSEICYGTSWSLAPTKNPGTQGGDLEGISCPSSGSGLDTLVEKWNGANWSSQISAGVLNSDNNLASISCLKTGGCVAVGASFVSATYSPLAEVRAQGTWSVSATRSVAGSNTYLTGVSCTSGSNCVAVGYYQNASAIDQTPIEQWNGTHWTIVSSPDVASQDNFLLGVRCVGASHCFAVGQAGSALIEQGTES
jgi:hypothetical protein